MHVNSIDAVGVDRFNNLGSVVSVRTPSAEILNFRRLPKDRKGLGAVIRSLLPLSVVPG